VHHSLKLILHLLDPDDPDRLKALKEELKVVAPSDNEGTSDFVNYLYIFS
jgi:hypothetical protein